MKISEARLQVTNGALQSPLAGTGQVDRAIQVCCNDFCNYTGVLIKTSTRAIAADAVTLDLATSAMGADYAQFRPSFFESARIGNNKVQRTDYQWVRRRLAAYPNKTGRPTHMGIEDISTSTGIHIYPKADAAYTLSVTWHNAFTSWEPGTTTSTINDTQLNIPERYIHRALWEGSAAMLVYGEATNNPWPVTGWKRYLDYREEVKRMASMDAGLPKPNPYTQSDQPTAAAPTVPEPSTAQG